MNPAPSPLSVLKAKELSGVPEEYRPLILQRAVKSYAKTTGQRLVDWAFMVSVSAFGVVGLFIGFLKWGHVGAILVMGAFVFGVCAIFGVVYNVRGRIVLRAHLQTEAGAAMEKSAKEHLTLMSQGTRSIFPSDQS